MQAIEPDPDKYNVLTPVFQYAETANPFFKPVYSIVHVNPDDENDVYQIDRTKNLYHLHLRVLHAIATAAGISFAPSIRVDDRRDPEYAEVTAIGFLRMPTGDIRSETKTKSIRATDYGDPNGDVKERKRYESVKKFLVRMAEAGAQSAVIRSFLAMPSAWKKEQLRKPFLVPALALNYQLIMAMPGGTERLLDAALQSSQRIYGQMPSIGPAREDQKLPALSPPEETIEGERLLESHVEQSGSHPESYSEELFGPREEKDEEIPHKIFNAEELENFTTEKLDSLLDRLLTLKSHGLSKKQIDSLADAPTKRKVAACLYLQTLPDKE